ncbi:MAG TPA: hypothetical protein VGT04_12920 [Acidobacteriaceae bacterium]|nr:hypothetical protein [Acidobacteriaceae bacterium]
MKAIAFALLFAICASAPAQDARSLVRDAVNAEIAADRADQSRWVFHEVDLKPGNNVAQWVAQTKYADVKRVVSINRHSIPKKQQRAAVQSFIHNTNAQALQRQSAQKDSQQAEALLKMLPNAFIWTIASRNTETTVFHFRPDPKFYPPTRQARVFAAMEGSMTVSKSQHRIQQLKGTMIYDVNFGWGGILGSLKKGGWFEVDRIETATGIWQINVTHVHIQGHALLFKTISEQEDDSKSNFTREPDNVTLQEAADALMSKPDRP